MKKVGDRCAAELQRVHVEHEPRWGDMPEQEQQVEPPIGTMASEIVKIEEMELGWKLKVLLQQPVLYHLKLQLTHAANDLAVTAMLGE